ncbi:TPA: hypothetical protein ACTVMD_002698 [Escherichia coli]
MKSAKFIACCFVEVLPSDEFYSYTFTDDHGMDHEVVGKRGDWLYITDKDCIFTKNQLRRIARRKNECISFNGTDFMQQFSNDMLTMTAQFEADSLHGAEY